MAPLVKDGKVITSKRHLEKEEVDLEVRRVGRIVKVEEFMGRYPNELSPVVNSNVSLSLVP
jgi:ABC-type Fe3+/spermidine/putrescine transport system ATPase subunit